MNRTRTRWAAALSATALAAAALAGCGGDDQGDDEKAASSAASSTATPSSSPSSEDETTPPVTGKTISVASFVSKLESMGDQNSVHMSIGGSEAIKLEADVRYGKSPAIAMEATIAGQALSIVIVNGTLYLQEAGGKYFKVKKSDPTYGALLDSFEDFGPRSSVEGLQDGITKVVDAGTEMVDGVELRRYEVTADTSKATGTFQELAGAGEASKFVTLSFYLDDEDLLRRIEVTTAGQKVAMTFSDWGKPVDIKAPSASELTATS